MCTPSPKWSNLLFEMTVPCTVVWTIIPAHPPARSFVYACMSGTVPYELSDVVSGVRQEVESPIRFHVTAALVNTWVALLPLLLSKLMAGVLPPLAVQHRRVVNLLLVMVMLLKLV